MKKIKFHVSGCSDSGFEYYKDDPESIHFQTREITINIMSTGEFYLEVSHGDDIKLELTND